MYQDLEELDDLHDYSDDDDDEDEEEDDDDDELPSSDEEQQARSAKGSRKGQQQNPKHPSATLSDPSSSSSSSKEAKTSPLIGPSLPEKEKQSPGKRWPVLRLQLFLLEFRNFLVFFQDCWTACEGPQAISIRFRWRR